MSPRAGRNAAIALVVCLTFAGAEELASQGLPPQLNPKGWPPPASLADPRLAAERRASVGWEARTGPRRRVVDLVCLVPDLPTFLEAVAAWDDGHYFPVLFDDPLLAPRFIEAFRPARVVRHPGPVAPIPARSTWARAIAAVGRSWAGPDDAAHPPGDARPDPDRFGPCPPGVVVSDPDSPTLAGAVALAAGRYQPLIRWEPAIGPADRPPVDEARRLARDLAARISDRVGSFERLGDACDFITLAGPWPLSYRGPDGGDNALDDLLGFDPETLRRRAYTGRLVGSPAASTYAAMASLFLRPRSALLFNGYDEKSDPWSAYQMRDAAETLARQVDRLEQRVGDDRAGLDGWRRAFDPINRFGLVLVNSSGSPDRFSVRNGEGRTADVPPTVPTAVVMIHSFSAADPTDPETLAGRWLANGAYAYFGAMNEPYLMAFRTPSLVSSLLADRLPLGAAVRQSEREVFGFPWRLVYLGDPLHVPFPDPARIKPRVDWEATSGWPEVRRAARRAGTAGSP